MTLIVKPHGDFEADTTAESAKVNDQINTIYVDHNGNVTDANIATAANIQQSKILNLSSDLTTLQNRKGYELISGLFAPGSATVDFTGLTAPYYDQYLLTMNNVRISVESSGLVLRLKVGGVFLDGVADYSYSLLLNAHDAPTPVGEGSNSTTGILLTDSNPIVSSLGGRAVNGEVRLFSLSATMQKTVLFDTIHFDTAGHVFHIRGSGAVQASSLPADGIQILPINALGTIFGQFALYGLRR